MNLYLWCTVGNTECVCGVNKAHKKTKLKMVDNDGERERD